MPDGNREVRRQVRKKADGTVVESVAFIVVKENEMAIESRSIPRQIIYLGLTFIGLLALLAILARWDL